MPGDDDRDDERTDYAVIARAVKAWKARGGASRRHLDVDDLIQDACLDAWRKRGGKRPDAPPPSPGLVGHAAVMSCRDAVYRDVAWRAGVAAGCARPKGPRRPPISLVDRLTIDDALDAIPAAWADAVQARYLLGMTIPEAAKALGATVDVVKERTKRGLAALRPLLVPSYEAEWARAVPLRDPKRYHARGPRMFQKNYHEPGRRDPKAPPGSYTTAALKKKLALIDATGISR